MSALSSILMKQLAIRLSPQAGESLVISRKEPLSLTLSRKREKGQTRKAILNSRERKRPYLPLLGKSRTDRRSARGHGSNKFAGDF
jgi:hypothetical protein